jgi:hypothetical protein
MRVSASQTTAMAISVHSIKLIAVKLEVVQAPTLHDITAQLAGQRSDGAPHLDPPHNDMCQSALETFFKPIISRAQSRSFVFRAEAMLPPTASATDR